MSNTGRKTSPVEPVRKVLEVEYDGFPGMKLVDGPCCSSVFVEIREGCIMHGDFIVAERHDDDCPELVTLLMAVYTSEVQPEAEKTTISKEETATAPESEATG